MGIWLDEVSREGTWRAEAQNFSEWLTHNAGRYGIGPASMWRYLSAARNYEVIRSDLVSANGSCPYLDEVAGAVSPEAIELALKIRRLAPADEVLELFQLLIEGRLARSTLRKVWAGYRDQGGDAAPRLPREPLLASLAQPSSRSGSAEPVASVNVPGGRLYEVPQLFCGTDKPRFCREFLNPQMTGMGKRGGAGALADRLIVLQEDDGSPVMLHGLFDLGKRNVKDVVERLERCAAYMDAVWLIQYGWPKGIWSGVLERRDVGVIALEEDARICRRLRAARRRSAGGTQERVEALQMLLASALFQGMRPANSP